MPSKKELIITTPELRVIKENLNWRCPVGNNPTYCPDGCYTRRSPCDELTRINGEFVNKCPYMRQWNQIYDLPPMLPNETNNKKYLTEMAEYFKEHVKFTVLRDREWSYLLEHCEKCGAHQQWFENQTYEDECNSYRDAVWKTHLLNEGKARVWNNELR